MSVQESLRRAVLANEVQALSEFFVASEQALSELTCQICANLFEAPVYIPTCLHSFCRACLQHWEANQKPVDAATAAALTGRRRVPRATCPLCRCKFITALSGERRADPTCLVRPNPVVRRAIYALPIRCPLLPSCGWQAPFKDLRQHVLDAHPTTPTPTPPTTLHVTLSRVRGAVDELGGFFAVEQALAWPDVARLLELPRSAGAQLRDAYLKKPPSAVRRAPGEHASLAAAAAAGDAAAVALLLRTRATGGDDLCAPLLLACRAHQLAVAALLLAAGARADCLTADSGESPLHLLASHVPDAPHRAAYRRLLTQLVAANASVRAAAATGATPLHVAARVGNTLAAAVLLTASSVDVDAVTAAAAAAAASPPDLPSGSTASQAELLALIRSSTSVAATAAVSGPAWTALHFAAASGVADVCQLLLQNGVTRDVAAPDEHGNFVTPLDVARARNHQEIVALLTA
jgi:ankyrin repeat protein